ncbi:MAG: monovalent cation/H(+) antiporter subunit G [Pseudomonadota bacterium]
MSFFIAAALVIIGSIFSVAAGLGLARLPDVFIRMHAGTKVGTLGSGLVLAGAAVHFADPAVVLRVVVIVFFLLTTAPIGAHMIGRAALRSGVPAWGKDKTHGELKRIRTGKH